MKRHIAVEEARQIMLDLLIPVGREKVSWEQASGRILAEDLLSPVYFPAAEAAALDGYAISREDLSSQAVLDCQEVLVPAQIPRLALSPGQTCQVCTGSPVPAGTAAVIGWEQTEKVDENRIRIKQACREGDNIKPAGEDFKPGQVALKAGKRLKAIDLSVLSILGQREIEVYAQPRITLFCLSPEIIPPGASPLPGQILDSNGVFLAEDLRRQGAVIVNSYYLSQDSENLSAHLTKAAQSSDLIVTIGGAAGGATDLAWELLRQNGADMKFWEVLAKPGSHCGGGFLGQTPVVVLSGNPGACFVIYQLLLKPIFRALQNQDHQVPSFTLPLNQDYPRQGGPRRFLRGALKWGTSLTAELLPGQKSSMLHSLVDCDLLLELPAGHAPVAAGDLVKAYLVQKD